MTSDVSAMYAPEQVLSTSRELQAMHAGIGPSWPTLYPRVPRDANPEGLEARRGQCDVGAGPGAAESRVGGDGLLGLALRAQRLREPEERPAVLRIPAQVLAIHRFPLGGAAGGEQDGAEGLAHGEIPGRRLGEPVAVLDAGGLGEMAHGGVSLTAARGELTREHLDGEGEHLARLEESGQRARLRHA